jgi:hypothetical protein
MQEPPQQRWPQPHTGPLPQRHTPPEHVSALAVSQATQVDPAMPHAEAVGVVQVNPAQHPAPQLLALHPLQAPPLHDPGRHDRHAAPEIPQAVGSVPARQLVPEQQPLQESQSHTQLPLAQRWPLAQGGALPHLQAPLVQVSAFAGSQTTQVAPPTPQAVAVGVAQVRPEQQPAGQLDLHSSQAPAVQLPVQA